MRLICPNCGAQYEVDQKLIPESGRDVQCSNCGHTWFQPPPHLDAGLAAEMGQELRAGADEGRVAAPPKTEPAREAEAPKRRGLDPQVASVLREEAEREAARRRAEGERLESQPDLGLEDPERTVTPRRPAREPEPEPEPQVEEAPAPRRPEGERRSRRDQLPDVDEINSTLRASNAPERGEEPAPAVTTPPPRAERRRRGRRLGFWLVVLIAVAAVLAYAFAPQIVEQVPDAREAMTQYVDAVNDLRDRIDALVARGVEAVEGAGG